jgi:hypothetical protein
MVFLPPEIEEDPGFYAPVCRARVQACATRILSAIHSEDITSWELRRFAPPHGVRWHVPNPIRAIVR